MKAISVMEKHLKSTKEKREETTPENHSLDLEALKDRRAELLAERDELQALRDKRERLEKERQQLLQYQEDVQVLTSQKESLTQQRDVLRDQQKVLREEHSALVDIAAKMPKLPDLSKPPPLVRATDWQPVQPAAVSTMEADSPKQLPSMATITRIKKMPAPNLKPGVWQWAKPTPAKPAPPPTAPDAPQPHPPPPPTPAPTADQK